MPLPGRPSLLCALAAAALSLAAAAAAPAGGAREVPAARAAAEPRLVARVELDAPARSPFTLRATLPLPRGALARAGGELSFAVRSRGPERELVPAQVEVVTRDAAGAPEVVELLARVALDRGTKPGAQVQYEVWATPGAGAAEAAEAAEDAPPEPPRVLLRARDVHGNAYALELTGAARAPGLAAVRPLKRGRWLDERRVAGAMALEALRSAPDEALQHLFGVQAYLGAWTGEQAFTLDLRVHNGLVDAGGDDPLATPLGAVYFQSLELVLPAGWTAAAEVADPFLGAPFALDGETVVPLVAPFDDGALHLMPPQAMLQRRLAIAPAAARAAAEALVAEVGLAFCVPGSGLWSWFEPATARYFPQREPLARMDFWSKGGARGLAALRADEAARHADLVAQLARGEPRPYPRVGRAMGWAHPWFLPAEGPPGGEDVAFVEGHRVAACASRAGYLRLELLHRMNACRQAQALWDRAGAPQGVPEWRGADGALPFQFFPYGRGVPPFFQLPCRGGPPASAQVAEVARQGRRPPYDRSTAWARDGALSYDEDDLVAWMPHDLAHLVRWTKNAKALVWLGNDSLAKDDLRLDAELFRLYFHEGVVGGPERPLSLGDMELRARAHPHEGLPMHRAHGWGMDAVAAAWALSDDAWRARHREWIGRVADVTLAGANPGGILHRDRCPTLEDERVDGCLTFHQEILMLGQRALVESVFRGVDRARTAALEAGLVKAAEYLFWGPPFVRVRQPWSSAAEPVWNQGPAWAFPVAPRDGGATPPYSDAARWGPGYLPPGPTLGGPEAQYGHAVLSWCADATQKSAGRGLANRYLRRTLELGTPAGSWKEKFARLTAQVGEPSYDDTPCTIGYLARLQALGALR